MLIHVERETLSVHIVVCTRIVANIDFRFSYYPRRTLVKPHPTKPMISARRVRGIAVREKNGSSHKTVSSILFKN
ncbi:hypothetical protein OUZ56_006908 [Daphnia magna]|uniref:Uncharacterized protein n=1 Tax=Daphnia magna TaxID=35525 RepID=A0ABQ9YX12_9CRUS|nr:hypothetical protein OUZ56_006908 [Daphnia magna]